MGFGNAERSQQSELPSVPHDQLPLQVRQLEGDLPGRYRDQRSLRRCSYFSSVKTIPSPDRLLPNMVEVTIHGRKRVVLDTESRQLGVTPIPLCLPAQDRTGQESFSPEGHQPPGVEV